MAATSQLGARTGADGLVAALERLGVRVAFGLPGVHNLPIWRALRDSGIRLIGVRHEQTAAYAADGYARASGELGVALVTTGPGAANTLAATGEAFASRSPVLVLATDIATGLRREGVYRGTLHETRDQTAMFAPVTKLARMVARVEEIPAAVLECGRTALAPSTGPVYLGISTDLLSSPLPADSRFLPSDPARSSPLPADADRSSPLPADADHSPLPSDPLQPPPLPEAAQIERAAELLTGARRPLIWAGGGALQAGAAELVGEVARRLAAPVITTYASRGLLAREHPCRVPGPAHAREVGELWDEADVVLAVGTAFDGVMTQNWLMPQPPTLISVNLESAEASKNYASTLSLIGDARMVLERLLPRLHERDALSALRRRLDDLGARIEDGVRADEPQAAALLEVFERVLPPEAAVVVDMCIAGYWLGGYWHPPRPRRLAYPVGWGTLGFGFPASLGAALATDGPTVCVTGDGGFMYGCGELATAVQERIPVTIVLVDDGGYGMLRFDQAQAGEEPFGVDLVGPDFEVLARAFGVPATSTDGFGEPFAAALAASLSAREPRMIVVRAALRPPVTTSPRWPRRCG